LWDTRGFETTGAACRWSRQFPADQLAPWAPGEAWASASIGAHHRSLICVGGRLAELSDLRSPPTAAAGVRLLELPSIKSPERLRCRVSVGPHGHLIGSEGNLRLVDDRMTGNRCLLHTRCPLHGAPTFARWLSEPSELLLLGAQTTGDIAAVRLQAADQSLPPRISSESRLLPLRPPAAGSAGASLDGLRGLAAVHRDSDDGDVLMLRFTGRGRLCLQHLKCTTDTTATEEELVARKATIKLNNKQCRKSRLPAKQAASLLSFKLPIEDGDIVKKLRSNILNQRPPLSLSADRRTPDSLPHLGIKEYCTAEEQAELEPGSLVLAKLWHGQDPTAAVKKRLAAFEALEIQRAEEAAAAAAGTDTPAADSDIFNADSSAA
uniref:Ubiquitin-like domain-containing protein n=2 Tax=Macrostomum lignano TaxID=282301 RepID=A0A1I8H3V4_9PLAT